MSANLKFIASSSVAALVALAIAAPASAHISIRPGVETGGSSTQALTAGQAGTLNFRVGHGCTEDEANIVDPNTGKSLQGTKWATDAFSVTVPVLAQGTGNTVPKAQYVPGWKTSLAKNSDGSYTVTWSATSRAFDLPDGPAVSDSSVAANQYADFGIAIKWAATAAGQTVFFPSQQTCIVDIPGRIHTKVVKSKVNGKTVTRKVTVTDPTTTHSIYNSWTVTDGSGADTVSDNTEHNTAPSVVVLKP